LSTAYWPMVWPSPEAATVTVRTGASALILPVRPPRPEDGRVPFPPAEATPPLARTFLRPPRTTRGVAYDFGSGVSVFSHEEDRGVYRLDAIDLTLGYQALERSTIADADPATARTEMTRKVSLARGDWAVRIETSIGVTCDVTHFHVTARLDAFEGDRRIFTRDWREAIPRDMM
ncbi:MAG: CocE/NonD family hydrolase, partial [Alphaproteobacteria bacterium]